MKIMIVGHGRHGKDTVAEMLTEMYGLKFTSSSLFCAERVMMPAFRAESELCGGRVKHTYTDAQSCFTDRAHHRAFWYDEICRYCQGDRARLTREILEANDIYVGARQVGEFMAAKNQNLFDFSIWVDRSEHQPLEDRGSMRLEAWMCDFWLDNNGTLEETRKGLVDICKLTGLHGEWLRGRLKEVSTPPLGKPDSLESRSVESVPQADGYSMGIGATEDGEVVKVTVSLGSFPPGSGSRP